jgi:glycosyltransferase involved in cell wall biosynthesis
VGTFSYWPNLDGLLFFLSHIFPLIQQEIRDVRLFIVGLNPPRHVLQLNDDRTIFVKANVPSIEHYYRQATVSVVPLRAGGGTRIKILEAFALGRPVVSTSLGSEGLDVINGKHLLIADDPHAFAKSCIDLLRTPRLCQDLIVNARELVKQNYTWDSVQSRVEHLARELLDGQT